MAPVLQTFVFSSPPNWFSVAFFCALSSAFSPPTCWPPWCLHLTCDLHLALNLRPQCRRSTVCRSPAWRNVCGELQSALSWRTTVCPCRGRRSWRRCQRRHWQNTTWAVCWTRPRTLTWAPGKSIKNDWDMRCLHWILFWNFNFLQ